MLWEAQHTVFLTLGKWPTMQRFAQGNFQGQVKATHQSREWRRQTHAGSENSPDKGMQVGKHGVYTGEIQALK